MRFTKMHGLGNDYIYVNGFEQSVREPAELAVRISDRHRGVGGDGLILILPPVEGVEADVRMRIFNADGSEAEMCGNGIRCVAKYVHDHGLSRARPLRVQTGSGVLAIDYSTDERGRLESATVDMGEPILDAAAIPFARPDLQRVVDLELGERLRWEVSGEEGWVDAAGLQPRLTCVSMGNPHAIFFCENLQAVPLAAIGPRLENHPLFPNRINVHFVAVQGRREASMRTWERGSGMTEACGTGACAVCVAGVLTGRTDRSLLAHLPGGDLQLVWSETDGRVRMTGPATEIFSGEWPERE